MTADQQAIQRIANTLRLAVQYSDGSVLKSHVMRCVAEIDRRTMSDPTGFYRTNSPTMRVAQWCENCGDIIPDPSPIPELPGWVRWRCKCGWEVMTRPPEQMTS